MSAIEKYNRRVDAVQSLLCVGLDSALDQLPARFQQDPHPQFAFNRWIIEQTHSYAAAFKLNTAFYEARGEAGWAELRQTMDYLRANHPTILTICDAKRADIGSTSAAYAAAVFDQLGCDAVTLHPYMGRDSLEPFLVRADRGCIILCRTSNPGARELQDLQVGGQPLWRVIAEKVSRDWNTHHNCMLVVGATYPDELRQVRAIVGEMPLLVPGIGAQGGDIVAVLAAGLDRKGRSLIINAGRSILFTPDPSAAAHALRDSLNQGR